MELVTIIKAISEVGVLLLCAAVVIWQVVNDKIRQNKKNDDYSSITQDIIEKLGEQNDLMLQQIIQKVDAGHIITSEEDKDISKVERELETYLSQILKDTNANRVSLFRYHNGGKDYNGKSFLRMSMTNEVVKGGTALIQHQSQNLFRSMFFGLIHSLEDNGYDYIEDIENIKDRDTGFYSYLKDFGINSKYSVALYNSHKNIIGFVSVDFANKVDVNQELIVNCLQDKKIKIETLLNL